MKTLWIARDKDGDLFAYENEPLRNEKDEAFEVNHKFEAVWGWMELNFLPFSEWFSEVTWENSPIEVELRLKEG